MLGLFVSFLAAFSQATKDIYSKHLLKEGDEYVVSFATIFFTLPFLAVLVVALPVPSLGSSFFQALITGAVLFTAGFILWTKALKHSDISATIPLIAFTPVFTLFTSPFIQGEFPSTIGLGGVLLVVAGSYVLNLKRAAEGWLVPFKALLHEHGPRTMLLAVLIISVAGNIDKVGVNNSSPLFWLFSINVLISALMLVLMLYKSKNVNHLRTHWKELSLLGFIMAVNQVFHIIAVSLTLVAYVFSIKRLSILISVLAGHYFFKEKDVKQKLSGSIIMVLGVVLIVLA